MSRRTARPRRAAPDGEVELLLAEARARAGVPLGALDVDPRTERALALAHELGAPVAATLAAARVAVEDGRRLTAEVRRASAEGRTVATGLVLAPPVLGPATAGLVTDEPLAFLGTPVGQALVGAAAMLWALGALMVWSLVRSASRPPATGDDELLELMAVGVAAGLGMPAAVRAASSATGDARPLARAGPAFALWFSLGAQGPPPVAWAHLAEPLAQAAASGVPLGPLLQALAARDRAGRQQAAMERAARLGARLSLPTALLLLPAALLVIAGPLLVGALDSLA